VSGLTSLTDLVLDALSTADNVLIEALPKADTISLCSLQSVVHDIDIKGDGDTTTRQLCLERLVDLGGDLLVDTLPALEWLGASLLEAANSIELRELGIEILSLDSLSQLTTDFILWGSGRLASISVRALDWVGTLSAIDLPNMVSLDLGTLTSIVSGALDIVNTPALVELWASALEVVNGDIQFKDCCDGLDLVLDSLTDAFSFVLDNTKIVSWTADFIDSLGGDAWLVNNQALTDFCVGILERIDGQTKIDGNANLNSCGGAFWSWLVDAGWCRSVIWESTWWNALSDSWIGGIIGAIVCAISGLLDVFG
jgi:hypothetical protein